MAPVLGNQMPPLLCHSAVHFVLKAVPLQVGFRLSLLGEDAGFFLLPVPPDDHCPADALANIYA